MRHIVLSLFALATLTFSPLAKAADSSSGCGLGWYVLKENSLISSSLRSTTHNFLPNTFSMTSGTSGCAKHSIVDNDKRSQHFAEANLDALKTQVAQGSGEYFVAFAATLGCDWTALPSLASSLQSNYDGVFQSNSAQAIVNEVRATIDAQPALAQACRTPSA